MLLWPLRVLSRVLLARVMSGQRKHNHSLYIDLVHDFPGSLFPDFLFWFFEYVGDGTNRLVGDLDAKTSKTFCDFL